MKILIVMGTHMPEVRACVGHLAEIEAEAGPVTVHAPAGLGWEEAAPAGTGFTAYAAAAVTWVFDPDATGSAFIILDPLHSPVPQLERLAADLGKCLLAPARIVTCVDCAALEQHTALKAYYEACIYYSDVVLLGNRAGASKPFLRDYQLHFERLFYPCLVLLLKGAGIPEHPLEILVPEARRLSQLFDPPAEADESPIPGLVIEASCDLDVDEPEADPFRPDPEQPAPAAAVPDVSAWVIRS